MLKGLEHCGISKSQLDIACLCGAGLTASALSLTNLGEKSLWLNEASSVLFVQRDWLGLWQTFSQGEANMGIYYILLKIWLTLGESEFVIRSLSAVFAVVSVPVVYAVGKQLVGTQASLTAAWILAINPFFIHYAQEARGYSLVLLLVCCSSYFFLKSIERPCWKSWTAYILFSVLAVYAHFFGVLVFSAHAVSLLFLRRRQMPWKGFIISTVWLTLFLLPLGFFILTKGSTKVGWILPSDLRSIVSLFYAYAGGNSWLLFAYWVLILIALIHGYCKWRESGWSFESWRYAFLLIWLFLPIILTFLVSMTKPIFISRYLIVSLPPMILLVGAGLTYLPRRVIYVGTLFLITTFSVSGVFTWYSKPHPDWRSATRFVVSSAQQGDAAFFYTARGRKPFDYYRKQIKGQNDLLEYLYPMSLDIGKTPAPLPGPDSSLIKKLVARHDSLWLVLARLRTPDRKKIGRSIQSQLDNQYRHRQDWEFPGIKVFRYRNRDST